MVLYVDNIEDILKTETALTCTVVPQDKISIHQYLLPRGNQTKIAQEYSN